MSSSSYWMLRRLAPRAKNVHDRRAADSPVLQAYGPTLPPAAEAYIAAYDAVSIHESTWRREMAEGRGATAELLSTMRSWLPLIQRDVEGFDASSIADRPTVTEDVLEDAMRLSEIVDERVDPAGKPLSYREACLADLEAKMKNAESQRAEAVAADQEQQGLSATMRETAGVFDKELQAFRRSLLAVVGRSDLDYQKLRAQRAHVADDDDDPAAPPAPTPVEPANDDDPPPVS